MTATVASVRRWRRWLWLALIATVPMPILVIGPGYVPAARLLMLGVIAAAVLVFEQASGAAPMLTSLLLAQGLAYVWLLWVAALIWDYLLGKLGAPRGWATVILIVVLLAAAVVLPLYSDPYQAVSPRCNLLDVYR